jgi:hypothetical protein
MHQLLGINGFVPLFFLISRAILLRTGVKFRNLWGSSLPTLNFIVVYLKMENSSEKELTN